MDRLTFITEILKAVAWPTVVIVTVIILRTPLGELLGFLRKFKYKDLELEFAKEVEQLSLDAAAVLANEPVSTERDREIGERIEAIASISPRAAVAEAWHEVEMATREMFKLRNLPSTSSHRSMMQQVRNVIESDQWPLFHRLYNLRCRAVHAADQLVSEKEAVEYGRLAIRLTGELLQPGNET